MKDSFIKRAIAAEYASAKTRADMIRAVEPSLNRFALLMEVDAWRKYFIEAEHPDLITFDTRIECWWQPRLIFKVEGLTRLGDIVILLEAIEDYAQAEFTESSDSADGDFRTYSMTLQGTLFVAVHAHILPEDDEHADPRCRRVLVGMDHYSSSRPRYEIRCD